MLCTLSPTYVRSRGIVNISLICLVKGLSYMNKDYRVGILLCTFYQRITEACRRQYPHFYKNRGKL